MIHFFGSATATVFAVQSSSDFSTEAIEKLSWLFGGAPKIEAASIDAFFIGPRAAMITPWSTNATEITQNMGISGIIRIEEFTASQKEAANFDPMLSAHYAQLHQDIFTVATQAEAILEIEDIGAYNQKEGLALSEEEVQYLERVAQKIGRKLTDAEVFGFSQVNSEHCRHKIFNGDFVINGQTMPSSLFKLIKKTTATHPNTVVSAYKDNVAFVKGPKITQFAPQRADIASYYKESDMQSVLSLKAETHNFPTTVEPFNGAATGSGGEIRDRLAGGKGSLPLAGTAVYMTPYSRIHQDKGFTPSMPERPWLYQNPIDILIKASNGASDFGNKFGQPLINGSVLTFEHQEDGRRLGYDKVIMQAGGVGYGKADQAIKETPKTGDQIVILGGDNYRIGMGGAAVSSADTGAFGSVIELNAIQRSNPEMQKRAANAIRGMVESEHNPIVSIHDHGAGGHLNCLSELVEETGGHIDLDALPVGDPTLSAKEIIGNESQERMGLVIGKEDVKLLQDIADRERAPMYQVGTVSGDQRFSFISKTTGERPMDLALEDMFGSAPKTIMADQTVVRPYHAPVYTLEKFQEYLDQVLQLEAVASKDWLTNKVDRCVGGKVAKQQCAGPLQLPLNNCGVMALDFKGKQGVATAMGHSPAAALISPAAGSRNAITEALTNLVWAPLEGGIKAVSLSANWMWPCNNEGEDARLYEAVQAVSDFAIDLGINIPTGKDSLSMKQRYPEGDVVAPGTVIISAVGHCNDIKKVIEPVLQKDGGDLYYINFSQDQFQLGGSSLAQTLNAVGDQASDVKDAAFVVKSFNAIQEMIVAGDIVAGHDIGSGGLITTLLEMCFADLDLGAELDLSTLGETDTIKLLFAENTGVVIQLAANANTSILDQAGVAYAQIGKVQSQDVLHIKNGSVQIGLPIPVLRDTWTRTSSLLDAKQTAQNLAEARFENYKHQPLSYQFPTHFTGKLPKTATARPKAAILREKGSNSEREMANAMYLAGFDVKDIHMTDLMSGRENLEDIQFIGAVGGFSNSDVLGSAKGWAGAIKYNENARTAIANFFARPDTLSIGICNGCQLFMELELINPKHHTHGKMTYNNSGKHESNFTSVTIAPNHSVMLSNLEGASLGVWISHGEGKFQLPLSREYYQIVGTYGYEDYPANPNGSDYNTAMLASDCGRHLVTMPHIERSIFPWNWAHYPAHTEHEVSPWLQAFVNARDWILEKNNQ
ncbi:phosphoribosylformylglycinamidine synthase [Flavobacteriaceae bacterium LSUCC0859]|nr:phosphoribosylformylglycinamidine synthase [Flavobacteriaceae bacterium LSUCC0859]